MRRQGHDPRSPSLAGSSGPGPRHRPQLERRGPVGLPCGRAAGRAAGRGGPDGRGLGRARPCGLSGGRADPPTALGPDHGLLVRSGRARRRRDRPRHGSGRGLCRSQPGPSLAHQSSPLAVPRRRRSHRHGRGSGGNAGPVALWGHACRAAGGRVAALVRASARTARRPASCRNRPDCGGGPSPFVGYRPVDDGVDLRSAPRWRRRTCAFRPR